MTGGDAGRASGLYGRRVGKPLSPRRARLMAEAYPALALDLSAPAPADLGALFPGSPDRIHLEIGFGAGEHLIAAATAAPDAGFIGVEPFVNGMAAAVAATVERQLANVRLFDGEASRLLDWLPPAALDAIDLMYPDPWPKKRHWKRRFVSDANVDRMARALRPGVRFRFASDIASYVEWTLVHLLGRADFAWTAERADDWRKPFPDWAGTRYEAKAIAAGRKPTYLTFIRC